MKVGDLVIGKDYNNTAAYYIFNGTDNIFYNNYAYDSYYGLLHYFGSNQYSNSFYNNTIVNTNYGIYSNANSSFINNSLLAIFLILVVELKLLWAMP